MRRPAAAVLGLWIAVQLVMPFVPASAPIAWWAPIGGILAGAVLVLYLRRPGIRSFDRYPQSEAMLRFVHGSIETNLPCTVTSHH